MKVTVAVEDGPLLEPRQRAMANGPNAELDSTAGLNQRAHNDMHLARNGGRGHPLQSRRLENTHTHTSQLKSSQSGLRQS